MSEHEIKAVDLPYEVEQVVFGPRTLLVRPRDPHRLYELGDDGELTAIASVAEGESLRLFTATEKHAAVAWYSGKDEFEMSLVYLATGRVRPMVTLRKDQYAHWAAPFNDGLAVRHREGLDDVLLVVDIVRGFVFRSGRLTRATPHAGEHLFWVEDFTAVLSSDERTDGTWTVREQTLGDARERLGSLGPGEEEAFYMAVPPGVTAIAEAAGLIYLATKEDTWKRQEAEIWTVEEDAAAFDFGALPIHSTDTLVVSEGRVYGIRPNGSLGRWAVLELSEGEAHVVEEIADSMSLLDSLTAIPGGVRWFESTQAWVFGEPPDGTPQRSCIVTATRAP
jgi:hypothetical protein